jgi:hypothetical protein
LALLIAAITSASIAFYATHHFPRHCRSGFPGRPNFYARHSQG